MSKKLVVDVMVSVLALLFGAQGRVIARLILARAEPQATAPRRCGMTLWRTWRWWPWALVHLKSCAAPQRSNLSNPWCLLNQMLAPEVVLAILRFSRGIRSNALWFSLLSSKVVWWTLMGDPEQTILNSTMISWWIAGKCEELMSMDLLLYTHESWASSHTHANVYTHVHLHVFCACTKSCTRTGNPRNETHTYDYTHVFTYIV